MNNGRHVCRHVRHSSRGSLEPQTKDPMKLRVSTVLGGSTRLMMEAKQQPIRDTSSHGMLPLLNASMS